MKKHSILFICSTVLATITLLSSCQNKIAPYESVIDDVGNDGLGGQVEFTDWSIESYKRKAAKETLTVSLKDGSYSITGKYRFSDMGAHLSFLYDAYCDDQGHDFYIRADNGELVYMDWLNGSYYETEPYLEELENPKETALEIANQIAEMYISDIDSYEYFISENVWKPGTAKDENCSLTHYTVNYSRTVSGFNTRDFIAVTISSKGHFVQLHIGDLDAFTGRNIQVDEEKLRESIDAKVKAAYEGTGYIVNDYEIRQQQLVKTPTNQICVSSSVSVALQNGSDTVSSLISILTAIEE